MQFLLDGYNILFTLQESNASLKLRREQVVEFFQRKFKLCHFTGILVFDGKIRRDEESGRNYQSPLEIRYTPQGESADAYIVHLLERDPCPRQTTVVTNDRGLIAHVRSLGAEIMSPSKLVQRLVRKKTDAFPKELSDSPKNIERLNEIFEKRLKEDF